MFAPSAAAAVSDRRLGFIYWRALRLARLHPLRGFQKPVYRFLKPPRRFLKPPRRFLKPPPFASAQPLLIQEGSRRGKSSPPR
jgi:hypothetical protein